MTQSLDKKASFNEQLKLEQGGKVEITGILHNVGPRWPPIQNETTLTRVNKDAEEAILKESRLERIVAGKINTRRGGFN